MLTKNTKPKNWPNAKRARFEVLQKTSNTPCVVWAGEPKTGLGFEIGPSYDNVPAASQYAIAWQSSCTYVRWE